MHAHTRCCVCMCSHLTFACLSCYRAIGYFATYICLYTCAIVGCQPTDSQCDGECTGEWERAHTQALPMDGLFARISGIIVCLLQMEKINVCDELESAILSHTCICLPTHAHMCVLLLCVYASTSIAITTTTNNNNKNNNRIYTWWMPFARYPWVLFYSLKTANISERVCAREGRRSVRRACTLYCIPIYQHSPSNGDARCFKWEIHIFAWRSWWWYGIRSVGSSWKSFLITSPHSLFSFHLRAPLYLPFMCHLWNLDTCVLCVCCCWWCLLACVYRTITGFTMIGRLCTFSALCVCVLGHGLAMRLNVKLAY